MSALVIVTGASRGLGLALALNVPFSASVYGISRSGPPEGDDINHIRADLSDPDTLVELEDRVVSLLAEVRPDRAVMIHAAGTLSPIGFGGEVDTDDYRRNVLLNSAAGQILGHIFLKALRTRPGTHDLVMITSGAARTPYPGWSSYGAGKAGLDQWVRTVGAEQKLRGGVRVSAIAPGVVNTDMQTLIRDTPERDFPDVDRFQSLHDRADLVAPEVAARRMWEVIEEGIETGSVIDLRDRT